MVRRLPSVELDTSQWTKCCEKHHAKIETALELKQFFLVTAVQLTQIPPETDNRGMGSLHEFHLYLFGPHQGPIESSFEQAEARLVQLPKLHFEPDGSFVWTLDGGRQQVFGMLYDANNQIRYCELRGRCESIAWRNLCIAIIGSRGIDHLVLKLPDALVQDLQIFQQTAWPEKT